MAPDDAPDVLDQVADQAAEADAEAAEVERDGAAEVAAWKRKLADARISPRAHEALAETRAHIDSAWAASDAGTEAAPAGKLRHVHAAATYAIRHVTSHQVPFNRELVVAVDRLTRVVEELTTRLEVVDELEERYDATLKRAQAGVATVGVQVDDLAGRMAEVAESVAEAADRLAVLEHDAADQRQLLGATRAREDLVLRTLRDASPDTPPTGPSPTALADAADAGLLRRLAAAGRPRPEVLVGWARQLVDTVEPAAAGAPVLDLDSGRGEWLDVWSTLDGTTRGTESDPTVAAALRTRGHDVTDAEPGRYLSTLPAGSVGAVTSVCLADVLPLADLVAVVDAASVALRPGGALVLVAAQPGGAVTGDILWADPRRRPVHPEMLTLLALERGFAETGIVELGPPAAEGAPSAYALVARTPGGAAPTP